MNRRHISVTAMERGHVQLRMQLDFSEITTRLDDGHVFATVICDPNDALDLASALFAETFKIAEEHAKRILEREGASLQ